MAFSNDMEGNIRSCGCLTKDYGGLGRRATFVHLVKDTSQNFLLLDGGDFFGTGINYGKQKAEVTMKSMKIMGYHGVVLGEKDFGFGLEHITKRSSEIGLPVLLANLFDAASDTLLFPPKRVVTFPSGLKVALIGVLGNRLELPPQVDPGSVYLTDPVETVRIELESLDDHIDLIVVLAHMSRKEAEALSQQLPSVDLVIGGHQGRRMRQTPRFGNAFVLQAPRNGEYMGLAYCKLNRKRKIETLVSKTEALSERYKDDEMVAKLFAAYDMDIKAQEKARIPTGTAARKEPEKPFVSFERCRECHEEIVSQWETTKHAHAFDILVAQSREFDRDCTPCHTTGFYKQGGFLSLTSTPDLINVQCESCHGNGNDHSENPEVIPAENASAVCTSCHNSEQSPDFVFEDRWSRIRH